MMKSFAALALVLSVSSFASANTSVGSGESVKFHGSYSTNINSGAVSTFSPRAQEVDVVVFDNLTSAPVTGFSRAKTDLPTFGAELTLGAGPGGQRRLQEIYFSIFNSTSGGNTGTITGGTMNIKIYDNTTPYSGAGAITNPLLANITGTLDYSADPLPAGFYLTDGFTGLNSLNVNLPTEILITQTFTQTGASTRNGYVSFAPDVVGSSDILVYLKSNTLAEGLYNLGTSPNFVDATPGYYIVVPEPASLSALALGGLVIRRRRA